MSIDSLIERNRTWAAQVKERDEGFFERLAAQQSPRYLWIGCADSRVPANQILGMDPGEVFVHRNIANLVEHTDMNCHSVIQYAVDVLKVTDVLICGHYGCGGVQAALSTRRQCLIDNWLRSVKDLIQLKKDELEGLEGSALVNRVCELNVERQVQNLGHSAILQGAWSRGQEVTVHGVVYGLNDGLLRDLKIDVSSPDDVAEIYHLGAE